GNVAGRVPTHTNGSASTPLLEIGVARASGQYLFDAGGGRAEAGQKLRVRLAPAGRLLPPTTAPVGSGGGGKRPKIFHH
ncbi:hypothetical protein PL75_11470, partial [Neisseria arctica]